MHKFGICIAKSVEEAKKLYQINGDNVWWDDICKEMNKVCVVFEKYKGNIEYFTPKYQQFRYPMIFDIKIGQNFRWKACMVAGATQHKPHQH